MAVWRDTRMTVMVAVTAALYAAVLIPMKIIMPLVPGFTEVRPANVLPILFSFLFGPVAAWGAAFGNVVADCFGTFGPGSVFGFFGNFLFGLIPYRLWRFWGGRVFSWSGDRAEFPRFRWSGREGGGKRLPVSDFALYIVICAVASAACGLTIAWGVDLLGFVDFKVLANIIFLNNTAIGIVLGPPLIAALGARVRGWGLGYSAAAAGVSTPMWRGLLGTALALVGSFGGLAAGNLAAHGAAAGHALPLVLVPFLLCAFLGALLL
jgi:hypothetical protein